MRGHGHHAGFDKEPKQPHGPKQGGRHPIFHSHSARANKRHPRVGGKDSSKVGFKRG